jgi:diphthamide synthase (EF-2-diphthine--ammonia ligase)
VKIRISAVAEEYQKFISVGEIFDQNFIRQLPDDIDPMGEKGEFHTEVVFK